MLGGLVLVKLDQGVLGMAARDKLGGHLVIDRANILRPSWSPYPVDGRDTESRAWGPYTVHKREPAQTQAAYPQHGQKVSRASRFDPPAQAPSEPGPTGPLLFLLHNTVRTDKPEAVCRVLLPACHPSVEQ